jgi:hypothetical protein
MPSAGRTDLPLKGYNGGEQYEERGTDWGDMDVVHAQFPAGDLAPLLRGLPDDRCQCPHWGFLLKGRILVRYADQEETITTGQSFYMPPGHAPEALEDCEIVQISPAVEQRKTEEVIARNLAAIMHAAG